MGAAREAVDLVDLALKRWREPTGLVAVIGLLAVSCGAIAGPSLVGIASWAAMSAATASLWAYSRRTPRARPDRVGFGIAVVPGDSAEERRFAKDFVLELSELIRRGRAGQTFQVIELPPHVTSGLELADIEAAERLRQRARCSFLLIGQVRVRPHQGKTHLVLDLRGIVAHQPLTPEVQKRFAAEFSELLPRRIAIPTDDHLLAFAFTSEWTSAVAKYIIGIAAALSGDLDYAEALFGAVQGEIGGRAPETPVHEKLQARLPERLAEIHEARANAAYRAWLATRDPRHLNAVTENLSKIDPALMHQRRLTTLRAISAFLTERAVDRALGYLNELRAEPDGPWYLNMAFLFAYKGNLKRAAQLYRQAAMLELPPDVPAQIEEFQTWVLGEEPGKVQLHYSLGLLNRDIKGDIQRASEEFRLFVDSPGSVPFPKERELAQEWLRSHSVTASAGSYDKTEGMH